MKGRLKAVLGWIAFHSGFYRRLFRNRALVVLFHRVDDRYRGNPISCTRAQFVEFLRFFRRFFRVVSLAELLTRARRKESQWAHGHHVRRRLPRQSP